MKENSFIGKESIENIAETVKTETNTDKISVYIKKENRIPLQPFVMVFQQFATMCAAFEKDQHYVAIRSICTALGIDHQKQFERIKNDPILGQLYTDTVYISSEDKKSRKMICLPLRYVFGWIYCIRFF